MHGLTRTYTALGLAAFLLASAASAAKPNLILIMTDDQAVRDMAALPQTVQLIGGANGVNFKNSFVSWALCCPSRTTTFTGEYAHNHGVLGNYPPKGSSVAFNTDAETLPVWLQRAGYSTTHVGKYLNGYGHDFRGSTYVPPGWTDWMGLVDPDTYRMWGYTLNHNGVLQTYGTTTAEDPAFYQTDVIGKLALDSIDQSAASGQPFFLSVAFLAPHDEIADQTATGKFGGPRPAPRHAGSFGALVVPRPPNFNEADLSDKPPLIAKFAAASGTDLNQLNTRYRRRLESLRAVDEAVAAIVARLAALNLLDNTYIVFTSDNGWFNGEHRILLSKYLMYEEAIRVPLLVRGPGLAPGSTDELVANVDLAPTFVELAGATAGRVMDGRSLMPYARDKSLRTGRPILLDAPVEQILTATITVPALKGLRTKKFTYVEYGTAAVEMYDLVKDPYQMSSVHKVAKYFASKTVLKEGLSRYSACSGETCRANLLGAQ